MRHDGHSPFHFLTSIGTLVTLFVLAASLTGCYTQLKVADSTSDARVDESRVEDEQTYADEYRRDYHRDQRRGTANYRYEYKYRYKYGAPYRYSSRFYSGWYDPLFDDPFFHDLWYRPYSSRFLLSFHFGAPFYYHRSFAYWHRYHHFYGSWYRPYRYHSFGYYSPYGYPSYASGTGVAVDRRQIRPPRNTIGRSAGDSDRRVNRGDRREAAVSSRAESSSGRIGRRSTEDRRTLRRPASDRSDRSRSSRTTRGDRDHTPNGRVGRRSVDRDRATRPSRSSDRPSRGQRTGRRSDDGSNARSSGRTSRSDDGGRSSRGSLRSGEEGSRTSRNVDNDDNGERRLRVIRTIPSSNTGRVGRQSSPSPDPDRRLNLDRLGQRTINAERFEKKKQRLLLKRAVQRKLRLRRNSSFTSTTPHNHTIRTRSANHSGRSSARSSSSQRIRSSSSDSGSSATRSSRSSRSDDGGRSSRQSRSDNDRGNNR